MKAIDFTVSEHNSVSIVFIFYQLKLIMCSKGANRDYRYPVGAFFVFTDRYECPLYICSENTKTVHVGRTVSVRNRKGAHHMSKINTGYSLNECPPMQQG